MRDQISRLTALFMVLLLLPAPDWATCGGGGGGGMGGMRSGGMADEQVYQVPWKLVKPDDAPIASGLVVYWFPSSGEEFQRSSLRNSRSLSLYAGQCVTMGVADAGTSLGQKFLSGEKLPVVVLAKSDGTVINKLENTKGFLKVDQVEKLVESEMKQREDVIKQQLKAAKEKAKSGDRQRQETAERTDDRRLPVDLPSVQSNHAQIEHDPADGRAPRFPHDCPVNGQYRQLEVVDMEYAHENADQKGIEQQRPYADPEAGAR